MESLAREVKSVPKSLDPSSSSSTDASKSMCVICLCEIKKEEGKAIFTGECSHSFHFGCIIKNVEEGNRICPICRFQWTEVPMCDVRLLEQMNWMMKKMEELEKKEHEREKNEHEREKNMTELKKTMAELKKTMAELEKKMSELEKIKREMENELKKRNKIIRELKKEINELKKKKRGQKVVEADEEDIGQKDSDRGVEAEIEMEEARELEGGSKKRKKNTMVRSSIVTRQKTREVLLKMRK